MMENYEYKRMKRDYENRLWDMKIICFFAVALSLFIGMIIGILIERGM